MAVPVEITAALAEMQQTIAQLRVELTDANQRRELLEKLVTSGDHGRSPKPQSMTSRKAFNSLPSYGGKAEDYDTWEFKMT